MSRIILIICVCYSLSLYGTTSVPDSLQQLLQQTSKTSKKIILLEELANYYKTIDVKKAHLYSLKAMQLATNTNNDAQIFKAQLNLGQSYVQLLQYDSAVYHLKEAELGFKGIEDEANLAETKMALGKICANQTDLDGAMNNYFEALKIWENLQLPAKIAQAYNGIADVLYAQHDYEASANYCEKAIALLEPLEDWAGLATSYLNLGYAWLIMSDYDFALSCMQKSLKYNKKANSGVENLFSSYNGIGNVYKYLENWDKALEHYQMALDLGKKTNYQRAIMVSFSNMGDVFLKQKKYQKALDIYKETAQMMRDKNDLKNLWENYYYTANAYAGLGDYKNAYQFQQLYAEEIERIYEEELDQMETGHIQKYEAGERAATIVLQEQQLKQQQLIQWLTFGIMSLLAIVFLLGWRNYHNKQKANQLLSETNLQLIQKNKENQLLLKEIHHRVKNNLQTISSLLSLQSAEIKDPNVLDAVQESQNRVRSMALIHQKLYQGKNLAAIEMKDYLETLGETTLDTFGAAAEYVDIQCRMDKLELDVDTAIPLGLIVNELLTNALKYAFPNQRKGKIQLSLNKTQEGNYQLKVSDNGVGMSKKQVVATGGTGFGTRLVNLLTMQLEGTISKIQGQGLTTVIQFRGG